MTAIVLEAPPRLGEGSVEPRSVKNGRPVSGADATRIARGTNWILGRGCTLIPAYDPGVVVDAAGSATFNFKIWARVQCIARLWSLRMRRNDVGYASGTDMYVDVVIGGVTTRVELGSQSRFLQPIYIVESIASPSAGIQDATVQLSNASAEAVEVLVEEIGCYELPRLQLTKGTPDYGVDVETVRSGEPIFDGVGESFGALADAVAQAETQVHRGAAFVWSVPNADGKNTTSGALADVFLLKPRVRGTKVYSAATTKTVSAYVRAQCSDGSTAGEVVFTSRLGSSVTVAVPAGSTSWAWFSGSFAIDCDDLTDDDGRRSSAWEDVTVQWRRTAGAGTVAMTSVEIGDA